MVATRKPGYVTQCDGGPWASARCAETTRLSKPGHWRCDHCVRLYGPVTEVKP